jgi:hypothetical protein
MNSAVITYQNIDKLLLKSLPNPTGEVYKIKVKKYRSLPFSELVNSPILPFIPYILSEEKNHRAKIFEILCLSITGNYSLL